MCIDSAAKPEDMHEKIGLWPCHGQGGNQVQLKIYTNSIEIPMGKSKYKFVLLRLAQSKNLSDNYVLSISSPG